MIKQLIANIYQATNLRIIQANQKAKTPKLPYVVYNVTSPYIKGVGLPEVNTYEDETGFYLERTEQYMLTVSFTFYGDDYNEVTEHARKVRTWFDFQGFDQLNNLNLVVSTLGNIENRTTFLVDSYEYKCGFDVQLRATDEQRSTVEWIRNIETDGTIFTIPAEHTIEESEMTLSDDGYESEVIYNRVGDTTTGESL
jgi:hypothetical protein